MSKPPTRSAALQGDTAPRKRRRALPEGYPDISFIRMTPNDDYTRVTMAIQYLNDAHRWSLKDFLEKMVTVEPIRHTTRPRKARVKHLRHIIENPAIREELYPESDADKEVKDPCNKPDDTYESLVTKFRGEIDVLGRQPSFGRFDVAISPSEMQLHRAAEQIHQAAPEFVQFLKDMTATYTRSSCQAKDEKIGPITMICAMIAFAGAPHNSNQFATLFGLNAYANGAKTSLIHQLSQFGITPSYDTIKTRHKAIRDAGEVYTLSV